MADPLAPGPIVTDAEVEAALIRLLSIRGRIGALAVSDVIIPTVSLGQTVPLDVSVLPPAFRSTDIFTLGLLTAPAANAILADTGQLAAGTFDVIVHFNPASDAGANDRRCVLQHRNAGNTANLMTIEVNYSRLLGSAAPLFPFGYEVALNERLRVLTVTGAAVGEVVGATIFARIRA